MANYSERPIVTRNTLSHTSEMLHPGDNGWLEKILNDLATDAARQMIRKCSGDVRAADSLVELPPYLLSSPAVIEALVASIPGDELEKNVKIPTPPVTHPDLSVSSITYTWMQNILMGATELVYPQTNISPRDLGHNQIRDDRGINAQEPPMQSVAGLLSNTGLIRYGREQLRLVLGCVVPNDDSVAKLVVITNTASLPPESIQPLYVPHGVAVELQDVADRYANAVQFHETAIIRRENRYPVVMGLNGSENDMNNRRAILDDIAKHLTSEANRLAALETVEDMFIDVIISHEPAEVRYSVLPRCDAIGDGTDKLKQLLIRLGQNSQQTSVTLTDIREEIEVFLTNIITIELTVFTNSKHTGRASILKELLDCSITFSEIIIEFDQHRQPMAQYLVIFVPENEERFREVIEEIS